MALIDSQGNTEPILEMAPAPTAYAKRWRAVRRYLLLGLALLPAFYLFHLIDKYGVNVPYADEFTFAPTLERAHDKALTFHDLFKQHSEHRYVFSRLLFIAFANVADGNLRTEMFFSAVLAGLSALNLWSILRRTVAASIEKALLLIFLLNLLLFSPVQAENWTWGFQLVLLFTNFLFTCGLLIATSSLGLGKKFALCILFAFVATFSFGGGMLLWALTFPVALLDQQKLRWKICLAWGAAWGCAGLLTAAIYFFDYVKPSYHPAIAASRNPLDYFIYITTFLGAHLSRASRAEPLFQAAAIGTVLIAIYSAAMVYAVRHRRNHDLARRMLPWFVLGGYAILNALLAAAARIGFGVNQALDSRYTSFSLYLSVAAIGLAAILKQELRSPSRSGRVERVVLRVESVLITVFAAFSLGAFSWGSTFMAEIHRTRLWGKGALLFSNVIDSGDIHDRCLMANAPEARAYANILDRIGLLHPQMLPSAEISKLPTKDEQAGYLDLIAVSGQSCSVRGWAIIPKTRTPAHCVVLSYQDPVQGMVAFRVADEIYNRADVAAAVDNSAAESSGWVAHFDRSLVPPGEHLLAAWAFDANRGILYPLGTPKILP